MASRGHEPVRTCVVCGLRTTKTDLIRVTLDFHEKSVILDREQCLGGRGAYVCPGCFPRLRFTKRVQKAFRNKAGGLSEGLLKGRGRDCSAADAGSAGR